MSGASWFRADLYRGTAPDYDRYRPPYPAALFEDLRARLPISGTGRLLDLGCGTGQVALALAGSFTDVVAVDQEDETVAFGRAKANELGVTNTRFVAASAELVEVEGPFELIAMGNSFHRMNRVAVAERAVDTWLAPAGGIALLWGGGPTEGDLPVQRALRQAVVDWITELDVADRVPAGWEREMRELTHEQVLEQAGLDYLGKFEYLVEQTWTLEHFAGYQYSTSLLSRATLGGRVPEFEHDLEERLQPFAEQGTFELAISFAYELARKPSA